jgi:biopolymer transport protein ExbB
MIILPMAIATPESPNSSPNSSLVQIFNDGGPVMIPLLILSIFSLAAILERGYFWLKLLQNEQKIMERILTAAKDDLETAAEIAYAAPQTPMGRFLSAPLELDQPEPDLFCLALETAADQELADMLKGEKLLESVVAIAPLLGLLGTVTGLIVSFGSLRVSDVASNLRSGGLTQGLSQALISTATGLIVAIATLVFQRLFLALHARQVQLFRKAGNELELRYRLVWQQRSQVRNSYSLAHPEQREEVRDS